MTNPQAAVVTSMIIWFVTLLNLIRAEAVQRQTKRDVKEIAEIYEQLKGNWVRKEDQP